MDYIKEQITQWLKEILVSGITSNLSGMFDSVNQKVGEISTQVGQTPQGWNSGVFNMIHMVIGGCVFIILGFLLFDSPIRRHRSYMLPWRIVGETVRKYYDLTFRS